MDDGTLCCWGEIGMTPAFGCSSAVPTGNRATSPVFMLFQFEGQRIAWESFHFDVAGVARQGGLTASDLVRAQ